MAEKLLTASDNKLIQYLNEAYGKEKELETALQAHIQMAASRASYKKRLQDHLKETKAQAKGLERRIRKLGGKAEAVNLPGPDVASEVASKATAAATKALATAKGAAHAVRGTGEAEKLLKNAKTELWNEYEEIGNYVAIETLAKTVGDKETEKLAREFRKQEERMASFLQKLLPQLTKAVATEEIPASERRANGSRRRSTTSRSSATTRSSSSRSTGSRASGTKRASSSSRSSGTKRSTASGTKRASGSSRSTAKTRSSSGTTRSSGSRSSGSSRRSAARAKS
jgi:ferritin-like metal-binding protein YciE